MMIFYFTATGNSLYVAKQLDNDLVSIPQLMKKEALEFSDSCIGIVCPVFGHEVPQTVKEFLHKAKFNTDYFYMVLTYGNRHGGAAELAKKLCDDCDINVNYINTVLTVDNWLPFFDMNEQKMIDKRVDEQISVIKKDITARKDRISPVTDADRAAHREYLERIGKIPPDVFQNFIVVTDACVGCGVCESVCPTASIRIIDGRTEHFAGRCENCLACVHSCPQKAIRLSVPEKNPNARYRNEHITLDEIIKSNNQSQ